MAKFLTLWEMDTTRVPDDPRERIAAWTMILNMIKDELKSGRTKDWGMFAGQLAGYSIDEGTEQEVALATTKFVPYAKFKVYPVLSVSQVEENVKALSQA